MSKEKLTKEQKKAAKAEKKAEKKAKGSNPEVSSALIQGVAALLCVGIIAFGANSITDKVNKSNLEIAGGGTAASDQAQQADGTVAPADDAAADDTAAPADDTASDIKDDVAADDSSFVDETPADTSSSDSTASTPSTPSTPSTSSKPAATQKAQTPAKKNLSAADILNIYNSATKKAADKKVAFSKSRNTIEKKYEAGVALKTFKSLVYQFMGVGDANKFSKTVTAEDKDSYYKYFLASSLTQADLAAAPVCKDNGNSYTITLKLKDGSSAVTGGKVTQNSKTALDKSGIACGENDKDYWDHKTAQNIYAAIDDVPGCKSATIKERYSNAVIVMNVTKDGKITSMKADFDFHVDIDGVMGSSGVAEAKSSLTMSGFKW